MGKDLGELHVPRRQGLPDWGGGREGGREGGRMDFGGSLPLKEGEERREKRGGDLRTFGGEEEAAEHDGSPCDSDERYVGYLHQSKRME